MRRNKDKVESDGNQYRPFIKLTLMGLGTIALGIYIYFDISAMEDEGIIRIGRKFRLFYDVLGKTGVTILFFIIGIILILIGVLETRGLIKGKVNKINKSKL